MSVQTQINGLKSSKTDLASAITEKGVTVPEGAKLNAMPDLVRAISSGSSFMDIDVKIQANYDYVVFTLQESGVKTLGDGYSGTVKAVPAFGVDYAGSWGQSTIIKIKNTGTCDVTLGYGQGNTIKITPGKAYTYDNNDHFYASLSFIAFECTDPNQKLAIQFG